MDCIRKYFPGNPIHIHAQEQVERFYHQWGFQSEGGAVYSRPNPTR
ncbi:hypothetical protein [Limosilactobacillus fermentum]|nr:hypothetical protein [Limosilactobacillus fermentum]UUV94353.1 hypothetical protein MU540_08565 [Limosilactobacillus fermentum]